MSTTFDPTALGVTKGEWGPGGKPYFTNYGSSGILNQYTFYGEVYFPEGLTVPPGTSVTLHKDTYTTDVLVRDGGKLYTMKTVKGLTGGNCSSFIAEPGSEVTAGAVMADEIVGNFTEPGLQTGGNSSPENVQDRPLDLQHDPNRVNFSPHSPQSQAGEDGDFEGSGWTTDSSSPSRPGTPDSTAGERLADSEHSASEGPSPRSRSGSLDSTQQISEPGHASGPGTPSSPSDQSSQLRSRSRSPDLLVQGIISTGLTIPGAELL